MSISADEHAALLSLAVHEFRTPLTVVAGYTKMLMNEQLGPLSDRQRQVLGEVEQQCKRLSGLLYEMSALADLANPETPPRLQDEIALPALLEEVTRGLDAGEDGPVAIVPATNAHPLTVRGDRRPDVRAGGVDQSCRARAGRRWPCERRSGSAPAA